MTAVQREILQRAIGIIEGVSCVLDSGAGGELYNAVEMLDSILEKDKAR